MPRLSQSGTVSSTLLQLPGWFAAAYGLPAAPVRFSLVPSPSIQPLNAQGLTIATSVLPSQPSSSFVDFSRSLLQGIQNLLSEPEEPAAELYSYVEISEPSPTPDEDEQCAPMRLDAFSKGKNLGLHRVTLKNRTVAGVPNKKQARQLSRRFEQLLKQPKVDATQIQPAIVNGEPVGRLGDRILFNAKEVVPQEWGCNQELLTIRWVNNLRVALGAKPLATPLAQKMMHRLQETDEVFEGTASWYGPYFHGRLTATGETFDQNDFTAAHPSLPFDTYLRVTNLDNGRSVIVRINDRGPYFEDRTLDLSREAARALGSESVGVVPFRAMILRPPIVQQTARRSVDRL